MKPSRTVLATIEAAAIDRLVPSPPITACCRVDARHDVEAVDEHEQAVAHPRSNRARARRTARRMARRLAPRMLIRSITRGPTKLKPIATATLRTSSACSARCSRLRRLESSTPGSFAFAGRTTAAATTGPARQPRPTSSTPTIALNPRVVICRLS
jgi:hypothetical protein